ncbi:MAG: putative Ig domain-containing protein [Deltaproteobacteria bacterium]|nr:putative Ig domain-containing protein [Deltaproteobacteria bacterium]
MLAKKINKWIIATLAVFSVLFLCGSVSYAVSVSYNGSIQNQSSVGIGGATIEQVGALPANTTTSAANGAFTLNVLSGVPFYMKVSKAGFADTYTAEITLFQDYNEGTSGGFNLFTPSKLGTGTENWNVTSGKGIIRARVRDQAGNPLGGAMVTVHSQQGHTYTVCYDDACSGLTSTVGGSGRYVVKNVEPGDTVTATAQKAGWSFNQRTFHIYADSVHQGGITGTVQPIVSYNGFIHQEESGVGIGGVTIEQVGALPANTTTSAANGTFALNVTSDVPFYIKISKADFADTYSAEMTLSQNYQEVLNYSLFTPTTLAKWGVASGKGIIRTHVRDQARNPLGGAVVTVHSQQGHTYTVCYDDACSDLPSTVDGWYIIKNVEPEDTVTVTAQKAHYTFNTRVFHTYANSLHGGQITGTELSNVEPVLDHIGDKTVNEHALLQFTITAKDPDGDALTYSASNLPSGASFDPATQIFSWTPEYNQAGVYTNIEFTVTDNGTPLGIDSELITITVGNVNRPPVFTPVGSIQAIEGQLVQFTVQATDPDGDSISYCTEQLPPGASFDSATRIFSWTPDFTQAGTYTIVFFASDNGSPESKTGRTEVVISVSVPPPDVLINQIINTVYALQLSKEVENSYIANLKKVGIFIKDGKVIPAVNQLNATIKKINTDMAKGSISEANGNKLIIMITLLSNELNS